MTSIVYFEDDANSRLVMDIILKRTMGIDDVVSYSDSANFEANLESLRPVPDLLLLDIHMKPYSGFDVLKLVRSRPAFNGMRVVAVTASVMSDEVERLRRAGFDGVIGKPIDRGTFPNLLERVLQGEKVWNPT